MSVAEAGQGFVRVMIGEQERTPAPGTDLALLAEGYATVTPIRSISEVHDTDLHLDDIMA
jgi:5'-nucleotidase